MDNPKATFEELAAAVDCACYKHGVGHFNSDGDFVYGERVYTGRTPSESLIAWYRATQKKPEIKKPIQPAMQDFTDEDAWQALAKSEYKLKESYFNGENWFVVVCRKTEYPFTKCGKTSGNEAVREWYAHVLADKKANAEELPEECKDWFWANNVRVLKEQGSMPKLKWWAMTEDSSIQVSGPTKNAAIKALWEKFKGKA